MRIIHCADLHLDSKMETNLTREQAAERKQELLNTFVRMVDYAVENDIDAIIIAGDLFDTPLNEQKRIKSRVLEKIQNTAGVDFLYLQGNHDKSNFIKSIENVPENLKIFGDTWKGYRYDEVVITGCELNKSTPSGIYDELVLRQEDTNIIVLHGQEAAYNGKGDGEIIYLNKLQNKYIDYLALGHIHQYKCEKLDNRGVYCYSGCLEGRGFDECGEKGFVLLDINGGIINSKFVPFSYRRCHEIDVNISDCNSETDILDAIEESIENLPQKDLVKVVLTGEIGEDMEVDTLYLKKNFENRFYFFKLYDRTRLKINYEEYKNDISLKGEFIRLVEAENLTEEEKNKIILTGIKALANRL